MRSQCSIASATLRGVEALPVTVEVAVSNGMPGMAIVGMPDTAVQEARERVRAAISAAGFTMPTNKIVVNLAPADLRKTGSGLDLPIALGILVATGQVPASLAEGRLFAGELALEGAVRPVRGLLAFGICAHGQGLALVTAPEGSAVPLRELPQYSLRSLDALHGSDPLEPCEPPAGIGGGDGAGFAPALDFKDVAGHEVAKRALQIAAAGNHGLLMMGPPGSGKTMLASRIGSILPPLTEDEMLEAAVVHSVVGEPMEGVLAGVRPFRRPHHSATIAGLVGGGNPVRPGEISLAHCGVLFLDEFAEFKPSVLQGLRQPMESGAVTLTRADGSVAFPARFMLIAATNPCACGYYGDDEEPCTCTVPQISAYQAKIGGPLMDRIDLQLDVRRLPPGSVLDSGKGTDSATLREGVLRAREFAAWRRAREGGGEGAQAGAGRRRAATRPCEVIASCGLDDAARGFIESMARAYALSGRALLSMLNVARTIADIEERQAVREDHIAEALGLRLRDGIGR